MILLVQDRKNNHHIVDYISALRGSKYTLCGVIYSKNEIINTFTLDAPVADVCKKCHDILDKNTTDDLNDIVRIVKGSLLETNMRNYNTIQRRLTDTKAKYDRLISKSKYWNKLSKMKRVASKNR